MRDRGVSVVVSYVLVLGIVTLLMAGLFITMSGFVESQRERAVRSELEVVGHQLATDLTTVSQLGHPTATTRTVTLTTTLPERVAGTPYKIMIRQSGDETQYELTLQSLDPAVTVTITVRTATAVEPDTVDGGRLVITYDTQTDEPVVVQDA